MTGSRSVRCGTSPDPGRYGSSGNGARYGQRQYHNDIQRVWDLMKKIGFAMLVTRDGGKPRARPMSAYPPGSVISYVKMAAAAVTGTRPDLGDNRKVAL
jgi:hypothetical protein